MRLFACVLTLLLPLLAAPALAQEAPAPDTATEPAAAGVDELIQLLENEEARNALIERLRAAGTQDAAAAAEAAQAAEEATIARQIAEYTRGIAESVSASIETVFNVVTEIAGLIAGADSAQYAGLAAAITELAMLAGVLIVGMIVLRLIARGLEGGIARRVEGRGWFARILAIVGGVLIDGAAVALTWAAGYFVALYFLSGPTGSMGINQTLLLNAFLTVEMTKVIVRAVFRPRTPALRFLPMGDTTAAYWYFWFARAAGLLGYAFMFVAPVLAVTISAGAAWVVQVLAMVTAVVIGMLIVLQNKESVRTAMNWRAANGRHDMLSRTLAFLGAYWHYIAIAYLIAVFVVWMANPAEALPFMLGATIKSIVAVAVGVVIISFISRFIHVGLRLPADVKQRLPLLETRLHAFVPRVMQVVRTITLIGVAIAIAQAWQLIDFLGWVASESGQAVTGSIVSALLIIFVGFVIYLAISSWVEYRLNPNFGSVPTAREKTLLSLLRNAVTVALAIFVIMLALAQIGVNIGPLLAGAGVVGLAIGFGAQKFVQDIITGVFIQLENIMNEGDVVSVGGISGTVEKLTIRSVSIRSLDGTLHLIPFSSVDMISNSMKGFAYHIAEIGVAYDSDIATVRAAMQEAFDELMETDAKTSILEPLEIHGVTLFGDSAINVRARIKTLPGSQWAIGRRYNEIIKIVFDRRGIEIPFPQVTYHVGVSGQAEALLTSKTRKRRKQKPDQPDQPMVNVPPASRDDDGRS